MNNLHTINRAVMRLRHLNNRTRLRMIHLLTDNPLPVTSIWVALRLNDQPSTSNHLRRLRDGGLVTVTRKGKEIYYVTDQCAVKKMLDAIAENAKFEADAKDG